jgi:hypothetical protein
MRYWFIWTLLLPGSVVAQKVSDIETSDITRFWMAYDKLPEAKTNQDSVRIIQEEYLNKASAGFREFIRLRNFTAQEYVALLGAHPRFWVSTRPLTEKIVQRVPEINQVLDSMQKILPDFERPGVCFAIGCMRTGGTTTERLILIGSEIAAADSTTDKSEVNAWLKSVLGQTGDIVSMVAHEAVHTRQKGFPLFEIFSLAKHKRLNLLNTAIVEGSADFITAQLLGHHINARLHTYGSANHCLLLREFFKDYEAKPFDVSRWLYNGNNSKDRPADLGYYIGYQISEAFYNQASDKKRALKTLLRRGKYKKVFRKSKIDASNCVD